MLCGARLGILKTDSGRNNFECFQCSSSGKSAPIVKQCNSECKTVSLTLLDSQWTACWPTPSSSAAAGAAGRPCCRCHLAVNQVQHLLPQRADGCRRDLLWRHLCVHAGAMQALARQAGWGPQQQSGSAVTASHCQVKSLASPPTCMFTTWLPAAAAAAARWHSSLATASTCTPQS